MKILLPILLIGLILIQLVIASQLIASNDNGCADAQLINFNFRLWNSTLNDDIEDPDENRDAVQIIESRGFIAKSYYVTTDDGYVLTLHRIVNPLLINKTLKLKPVILQHGLIASSTDFIINSPGDYLDEPLINVTSGKNLGMYFVIFMLENFRS